MNELTDLEIRRKIAEIEGAKETLYSYSSFNEAKELTAVFDSSTHFDYNPLTDDALWVQLIDKHNVSINTHFWNPSVKQCYIIRQVEFEMITGKTFSASAFGLKKAACLAIIDSKE
jgi:hypothetical protein